MRVTFTNQSQITDLQQMSILFNGNLRQTIETITDASINNHNVITLNCKEITVTNLLSHVKNCDNKMLENRLSKSLGNDFKSNFYLLSPELQDSLLSLLEKIKDNYSYNYGTIKNLSAYNNANVLDFYINISGAVGSKGIYDFINTLTNYTASLLGTNNSLPLKTVVISKWVHLKNGKNSGQYYGVLYDRMLNILGLSINTDCFEADVDILNRLINQL